MPAATSPSCRRCGACCRRGGPALHEEDRPLVEEGGIPLRDLFTVRRGEWVREPMRPGLVQLAAEIVKVKGAGGGWACRLYDEASRACRIYERRPRECRLLDCRDPHPLLEAYPRGRLTRINLLAAAPHFRDLVLDHERRCDLGTAWRLLQTGEGPAAQRLAEMAHYDAELRRLLVGRGGLDAGLLDFLFGRPVETVLRLFRRRLAHGPDAAEEGADEGGPP
ncbi:MAG: YkgJ family cysteine cluster protein [Desulfobacterales bacterium]